MSLLNEWYELLQPRADLVGGNLEQIEYGAEAVLRGPIVGITITRNNAADPVQGTLEFDLAWVATAPLVGGICTGRWTAKSGTTSIPFSILPGFLSGPRNIGDGRIFFDTITGTRSTLYPDGYPSNLAPGKVRGLKS
jgi:hypothetical protein